MSYHSNNDDEDKYGYPQSAGFVSKSFDIAIVGAGILGICLAYWISELYDCSVCLIDKEDREARHASSRNTGVVHRPFYLDPLKKKVFAAAAQKSYYMWSSLAKKYDLPWGQHGTLELATREEDVSMLSQYKNWAIKNGMGDDEIAILDPLEAGKLEPEIRCTGAIFSKTDTSVDYGEFSRVLLTIALANGIKFLSGLQVVGLKETKNSAELLTKPRDSSAKTLKISCRLLINAAGGGSLDLAHMLGLAKNYTDLHFRGDYWIVDDSFGKRISRNIYTVAKYKEFPFLDPHFIVRANGTREIGPNAALVSGPYSYTGLSTSASEMLGKIFERPITPKLKLFTNRRFLSLVWNEWRSSTSKKAMCERMRAYIPSLSVGLLKSHGLAGVRSSLIDAKGFVPEALVIQGQRSFHILNYNSPGATGAPSFSAYLVDSIQKKGHLDKIPKRPTSSQRIWDFEIARDFDLLRREDNTRVCD